MTVKTYTYHKHLKCAYISLYPHTKKILKIQLWNKWQNKLHLNCKIHSNIKLLFWVAIIFQKYSCFTVILIKEMLLWLLETSEILFHNCFNSSYLYFWYIIDYNKHYWDKTEIRKKKYTILSPHKLKHALSYENHLLIMAPLMLATKVKRVWHQML